MQPDNPHWQILESGYALDHPWCRVRVDKVLFPSGVVDDYYLVEFPCVVLIFPVTEEGEVIFVKQYKHGAGGFLLELPGGCFNPKEEEALAAAQRELREETGGVAEKWTYLGMMYENPTKTTNEIHLYLAEDVQTPFEQKLDPTENIQLVNRPLNEVMEMVRNGTICASTSLALAFKALDALQNQL